MHELKVARFYFSQRQAYKAAASRAREIVEKYPSFSRVDEARCILWDSLRALGATDEANQLFGSLIDESPAPANRVAGCSVLDEHERPDWHAFQLERDGVLVEADGGLAAAASAFPPPFR